MLEQDQDQQERLREYIQRYNIHPYLLDSFAPSRIGKYTLGTRRFLTILGVAENTPPFVNIIDLGPRFLHGELQADGAVRAYLHRWTEQSYADIIGSIMPVDLKKGITNPRSVETQALRIIKSLKAFKLKDGTVPPDSLPEDPYWVKMI